MSLNESQNPCEMLGKFQYIRISPFYEDLIERGIQELNEVPHELNYHPIIMNYRPLKINYRHLTRGRDGTTQASLQGERLFLFAVSRSRPPFFQLMVITRDGDVFLPGTKADHFYKVVDLLDLDSLLEKVTLMFLARSDYSVFFNKSAPRRILTPEDAKQCGFEVLDSLERYSSDLESLWWQEWGGKLYACLLDAEQAPPLVSAKVITEAIGNYRPLPDWLKR